MVGSVRLGNLVGPNSIIFIAITQSNAGLSSIHYVVLFLRHDQSATQRFNERLVVYANPRA